MFEMSALVTPNSGQLTLSTQLIKPKFMNQKQLTTSCAIWLVDHTQLYNVLLPTSTCKISSRIKSYRKKGASLWWRPHNSFPTRYCIIYAYRHVFIIQRAYVLTFSQPCKNSSSDITPSWFLSISWRKY